MVFLCKFGQNPPIGSGDRVQKRLIFTVFIVWWPWKLGEGQQIWPSQHYNIWSLARIWHLVQERVQTSFFRSKFENVRVLVWPWKWGQDHQNLIISFLSLSIMCLCKFRQNPPIGSGDRVQKRLIFTVFIVWWPWKLGEGQQIWPSQHYNIWSLARIWHLVQERVQTSFFRSKFENVRVLVWPWKWGQDHQNLIISFLSLSIMCLCKFRQNPPIGSGDRVQTRWWDLH